jgi:hypothetical protein
MSMSSLFVFEGTGNNGFGGASRMHKKHRVPFWGSNFPRNRFRKRQHRGGEVPAKVNNYREKGEATPVFAHTTRFVSAPAPTWRKKHEEEKEEEEKGDRQNTPPSSKKLVVTENDATPSPPPPSQKMKTTAKEVWASLDRLIGSFASWVQMIRVDEKMTLETSNVIFESISTIAMTRHLMNETLGAEAALQQQQQMKKVDYGQIFPQLPHKDKKYVMKHPETRREGGAHHRKLSSPPRIITREVTMCQKCHAVKGSRAEFCVSSVSALFDDDNVVDDDGLFDKDEFGRWWQRYLDAQALMETCAENFYNVLTMFLFDKFAGSDAWFCESVADFGKMLICDLQKYTGEKIKETILERERKIRGIGNSNIFSNSSSSSPAAAASAASMTKNGGGGGNHKTKKQKKKQKLRAKARLQQQQLHGDDWDVAQEDEEEASGSNDLSSMFDDWRLYEHEFVRFYETKDGLMNGAVGDWRDQPLLMFLLENCDDDPFFSEDYSQETEKYWANFKGYVRMAPVLVDVATRVSRAYALHFVEGQLQGDFEDVICSREGAFVLSPRPPPLPQKGHRNAEEAPSHFINPTIASKHSFCKPVLWDRFEFQNPLLLCNNDEGASTETRQQRKIAMPKVARNLLINQCKKQLSEQQQQQQQHK